MTFFSKYGLMSLVTCRLKYVSKTNVNSEIKGHIYYLFLNIVKRSLNCLPEQSCFLFRTMAETAGRASLQDLINVSTVSLIASTACHAT